MKALVSMIVLMLLCLAPCAAADQNQYSSSSSSSPAKVDHTPVVAIGYTVVHQLDRAGTPVGWVFKLRAPVTNWLSLAAQVDGSYRSSPFQNPIEQQYSFLDGPVFTWKFSHVQLFGHTLFGIAHTRNDAGVRGSDNRFAWQPGVGVDVGPLGRASVLFEINHRELYQGASFTQFISGIVFR